MKPIKMIRSLVLLAVLAAGAVGCQKEELSATGGNAAQGTPLIINVTDDGYTNSNAHTRAVENGYITQFTAGDKIGIYVVKPDGSYAHENVALTLTDNGSGTLAWIPPTGTTLYYEGATAGLKYYAYYPYQSSLTGTPTPSAADAAGFFANVVSQWTPAADQSTYASYTASDLMIGSGTASKQADAYTLALTMIHTMALVVIETPMTKYTFSNSSPAIPDYYTPAPDTKFYGFTPYSPAVGTYRLLVKPTQNGANDLMGSYTAASGTTKEYTIAQNSISAANYVHYKVDNATVTEKSHTLQAGDFYLKDGSLLGKGETPTAEQKAACLGIVYWVGDPTNTTNGDPLLARDKSGCTHGLVVALHHAKQPSTNVAAKMYWSISYEDVNAWTNSDNRGDNKVNITEQNRHQGYANTVALKAYNALHSNDDYKVLPIAAIEQYSKDYPAPSNSSGWYVPSIKELGYVCRGQGVESNSTAGRNLLNGQFAKAGGTDFGGSSSWGYWSSSESVGYSLLAWGVAFSSGGVGRDLKYDAEFWVRALFAF